RGRAHAHAAARPGEFPQGHGPLFRPPRRRGGDHRAVRAMLRRHLRRGPHAIHALVLSGRHARGRRHWQLRCARADLSPPPRPHPARARRRPTPPPPAPPTGPPHPPRPRGRGRGAPPPPAGPGGPGGPPPPPPPGGGAGTGAGGVPAPRPPKTLLVPQSGQP